MKRSFKVLVMTLLLVLGVVSFSRAQEKEPWASLDAEYHHLIKIGQYDRAMLVAKKSLKVSEEKTIKQT